MNRKYGEQYPDLHMTSSTRKRNQTLRAHVILSVYMLFFPKEVSLGKPGCLLEARSWGPKDKSKAPSLNFGTSGILK